MDKLRIGLLLDDYDVPMWVHSMTKQIIASKYAAFSLIITNECPAKKEPLLLRITKQPHRILFGLYVRLDKILFATSPDAFAKQNIQPLLKNIPVIKVLPETSQFSDRLWIILLR